MYRNNNTRPTQAPQQMNNYNSANLPLANLSPYMRDVSVVVKITNKGDIRTFRTKDGKDGQLINIDLTDEHGSVMKGKAFGEVVDVIHNNVHLGNVYRISGFKVNLANPKFNRGATCTYEATFDVNTRFDDASANIADISLLNLKNIEEISKLEPSEDKDKPVIVNLMAVVLSASPVSEQLSKANNKYFRRDLVLIDTSLSQINCTIFGDIANKYSDDEYNSNPVIVLRNVTLSEFQGKSLTVSFQSEAVICDTPETRALSNWYKMHGSKSNFVPVSQAKGSQRSNDTIVSIKQEKIPKLLQDAVVDPNVVAFANIVACCSSIRFDQEKKPYYTACPKYPVCQKKVNYDSTNNSYYCSKCDAHSPNCSYSYVTSFLINDHTDSMYVSIFGENGTILYGCSANELANENAEPIRLDDRQYRYYNLGLRIRVETNPTTGEPNARTQVYKIEPVSFEAESAKMLDELLPAEH